jgi:uncharacterized cupredoxin-like copper-binding protein
MKGSRMRLPWQLVAIPAVALVIFLTACGGGGAKEVKVSLKEWSVAPEVAQVKPGKVRFVVANDGTEPHELVIIRSDLSPGALPVVEGKVDEEKVDIVDEIEPFAAGTTERKTVELKAGKYLLICNIVEKPPGEAVESHYEKGMRTAFLVSQ